jgi:hypothetical protein
MVGSNATPCLPPLVYSVQAVGRIIADREIDSLPHDELRARMRAVLQVLDRELKTLLSPPDKQRYTGGTSSAK